MFVLRQLCRVAETKMSPAVFEIFLVTDEMSPKFVPFAGRMNWNFSWQENNFYLISLHCLTASKLFIAALHYATQALGWQL